MPPRAWFIRRNSSCRGASAALDKAAARDTIPVAGAWVVERRYNRLEVRQRKLVPAQPFRRRIRIPGKTTMREAGLTVVASVAPRLVKDKTARLGSFPARASIDWTAVGKRTVIVRSWKPGDRMKPLGMKGSKKLQDIFVDGKVPLEQRRRLPLFECDDEIVWLPGYRVAAGWEVTDLQAQSLHIRVEEIEDPQTRRTGI